MWANNRKRVEFLPGSRRPERFVAQDGPKGRWDEPEEDERNRKWRLIGRCEGGDGRRPLSDRLQADFVVATLKLAATLLGTPCF